MKLNVPEVIENLHTGITLPQFSRLLLAKTMPKNTRFNMLTLASAWLEAANEFNELSDGIAAAYHWVIYCVTDNNVRKELATNRWKKFVSNST